MVSRWDIPLGYPEQLAKLLTCCAIWAAGLWWWMTCLPRDLSIPPKYLKEVGNEQVILLVWETSIEGSRRAMRWTSEREQKNQKLGPYSEASVWCEWFIIRKPADLGRKVTGNAWYIMWETGSSSSYYFSMASPGEFSERALQTP